jgi:hypothetical protein
VPQYWFSHGCSLACPDRCDGTFSSPGHDDATYAKFLHKGMTKEKPGPKPLPAKECYVCNTESHKCEEGHFKPCFATAAICNKDCAEPEYVCTSEIHGAHTTKRCELAKAGEKGTPRAACDAECKERPTPAHAGYVCNETLRWCERSTRSWDKENRGVAPERQRATLRPGGGRHGPRPARAPEAGDPEPLRRKQPTICAGHLGGRSNTQAATRPGRGHPPAEPVALPRARRRPSTAAAPRAAG